MPPEQQMPEGSQQPNNNPVGGGESVSPVPQQSPVPSSSNPVLPSPNNNPIGQENVKNYQVAAILVLVLCSLPLGVAALIYSGIVKKSLKSGDIEGAKKASKTAKILIIIGVVAGLPLTLLYIASLGQS